MKYLSGWWFGTFYIFSTICGMSSFPLTNSIIFQDGYCTTKQVTYLYKIYKINITQLSSMISILCCNWFSNSQISIYWNQKKGVKSMVNFTIPGLLEADVVTYGAVMTSCQTSDQWWHGRTGPVMELGISTHLGNTWGIFFLGYSSGNILGMSFSRSTEHKLKVMW